MSVSAAALHVRALAVDVVRLNPARMRVVFGSNDWTDWGMIVELYGSDRPQCRDTQWFIETPGWHVHVRGVSRLSGRSRQPYQSAQCGRAPSGHAPLLGNPENLLGGAFAGV
jgi:hypothetical protein